MTTWQEHDDKATPGPWTLGSDSTPGAVWLQVESEEGEPIVSGGTDSRSAADLGFIAAARTAWPEVERERDQLRALLRQVREQITQDEGRSGWRSGAGDLIDESGLLDGGQQQ